MLEKIHPDLRHLAEPIESLCTDPKNANKHGERNLEAIAASYEKFGQRKPLVGRRAGRIIEAGNGTLQSLQARGWTHVAVLWCDDDEDMANAYALADNQSARLAEWDFGQLADNVEELLQHGWTVTDLGWSQDEIDTLLRREWSTNESAASDGEDDVHEKAEDSDVSAEDEAENDVPSPPPEPKTKPGDVIQLGPHTLYCGDCMDLLRSLPDNSVDAIVTDPPYGLSPDGRARTWDDIEELRKQGKGPKAGFMGKEWDAGVPGVTWARECLRVLKPGGHIIAHSATRTVHRLACALEDAGFELRDTISWLHWQGFPKSMDVSKAIDKMKHNRDEVLEITRWIAERRDAAGLSNADIDAAFGFAGMAGHWTSQKSQPSVPTLEQLPTLLTVLGVDEPPPRIKTLLLDLNAAKGEPGPNWWKRNVTGRHEGHVFAEWNNSYGRKQQADGRERRDNPATPEANKWRGWGTSLKPACEPAVLARKPISESTVAENVLKWGTGALNIDACRFARGDKAWPGPDDVAPSNHGESGQLLGRWPANIYACPKPAGAEREAGAEELPTEACGTGALRDNGRGKTAHNVHPTVKPRKLYTWLLRLVTPPGGTVIEPFGGSGTTLVAASELDCQVIATEREPAYCDIIVARTEHALRRAGKL